MTSPKPLRGLSHTPRRALLLASAALLCLFLLPAVGAQADTSSTLSVVGTSDVSDSGLIPNLIQPAFHAAYPQFSFTYTGTNTFKATNDAETGGYSVLIVHAASIENQFVAGGYSYNPYGSAIFRNDFVFAGPSGSDPAGVTANASNNIVQAFEDVATAGYDSGGSTPGAYFVARDSGSGTSVSEHSIWALVAAQPTQPPGLLLCAVPAAIGGGLTPIAPGFGVTADGQACPGGGNDGLPPNADFPDWYIGTTLDQGPTVTAANACTFSGSDTDNCYVYTDRGTFDYLSSGLDPAGAITLNIDTRNNSPSAPGGAYQLVNYFHAYVINPNANTAICAMCETVNLAAAKDFVSFITSPAIQSELSSYLDGSPADNDNGGPPFVADASPTISAAGFPSIDNAGSPVTVTGTVTNNEIGYPALANQTVQVDELEGGLAVVVGSGTTNSSGGYSVTFTPGSSGTYQVATGQITQVENSTLSPIYADMLAPGASAPVSVSVQGAVTISSATASPGGVTVSGAVGPAAPDANARVNILARPLGSTGAYTEVGGGTLGAGQASYAISATLAAGKWQVESTYADPGQLIGATSSAFDVTSTASSAHSVSFKSVKAKKGKITVTGKLTPGPFASGAKVELLVLETTSVKKTKTTRHVATARIASVGLKQVAHTSVGTGKTTFTIKTKLKRGYRWILQLEYVQKGQTSSYSKLSSLAVH